MLKDARTYQIFFLSLFLLLGIVTRDWSLRPEMIGLTIVTCLITQVTLATLLARQKATIEQSSIVHKGETAGVELGLSQPAFQGLPSALITGLGLSVLLRADHYSTMMLAAMLAIASKFVLRVQDKHLFNPANFGIIAALVLTRDAWVSPGQWGEEGWYAMVFLAAGGIVLQRVGRWDTTVSFLVTYAGLEAVRNLWLGWTWDVWLHRLMSGSLLLFALFMVTDPRTIPNARVARIVWVVAIALLTFILRNVFFLPTAVFWALFILAPLSVVCDRLWSAPAFVWLDLPKQEGGDLQAPTQEVLLTAELPDS